MSHRVNGFTLIELLVVIAVIALLVGIGLPSLAGARKSGMYARELAASRQLMQGYIGYAMENRDAFIAGHIPETSLLTDDLGNPLSPAEVTRRWPWRLIGHLNAGVHGTLLVGERSRTLSDRAAPMWSYMVSLTPTFGLNYYNLGGDLAAGGANNSPGCITRMDLSIAPTRLIVFASARSPGETAPVQGYFRLVPPTKPFEYSETGWSSLAFQEGGEPAAWGYVHPRWHKSAAVAFLDGHSGPLGMNELRDMTRWSNAAARKGDPAWRAP